jgi:nucleotide sugar dehydrogenase
MTTIGVIGVGSIGSVLADGFSQLGFDVCINDVDEAAVEASSGRYMRKECMADNCEFIFLALPTPTTDAGGDISAVDETLAELAGTDATVVIRSTMPPESTQALANKHDMDLVYSPEFLRDRSTTSEFFQPDRIVLAGPKPKRAHVRQLLDRREIKCNTWIERENYLTAELGKYAHNALFATKVSFANQMRLLAEAAGADPQTVMDIVTADHRNTGSHLDPMLGPYGGSCLPKDLGALRKWAAQNDKPTPLLDGTHQINQIAKGNYEYLDIEGNWPDIEVVVTDGE